MKKASLIKNKISYLHLSCVSWSQAVFYHNKEWFLKMLKKIMIFTYIIYLIISVKKATLQSPMSDPFVHLSGSKPPLNSLKIFIPPHHPHHYPHHHIHHHPQCHHHFLQDFHLDFETFKLFSLFIYFKIFRFKSLKSSVIGSSLSY